MQWYYPGLKLTIATIDSLGLYVCVLLLCVIIAVFIYLNTWKLFLNNILEVCKLKKVEQELQVKKCAIQRKDAQTHH